MIVDGRVIQHPRPAADEHVRVICAHRCNERNSKLTSVPLIIRISLEYEDSDKTPLPSRKMLAKTIVDNDPRSIEVRTIEYIMLLLLFDPNEWK